jgi:ATP-dependent protease ClpP protease subunit
VARASDKHTPLIECLHNNNVDVNNRIIYMASEGYGTENEENLVDFAMATRFIKNINYLNSVNYEPITVKMLTPGGCWFYGMSMYDSIINSPSPVDVHGFGYVSSMSSIIIQAARERVISKHSAFMVHYGDYADSGDLRKCVSGIDYYKSLNKVMLDIYANRCAGAEGWADKSVSQISLAIKYKIEKLIDWWMPAEEALYYGFCDRIE